MRGGELMKKIFYTLALLIPSILNTPVAKAQWVNNSLNDAGGWGLGQADLKTSINNLIRVILGFLGILATVIILLGGFKWMTSQGNSEKVDEAKDLIKNGIIGLVIIFSAYAISAFVMKAAFDATTVAP